jgi:ElaB/YqjD/DUF883 family membrane-anchored ribosome-binding protein
MSTQFPTADNLDPDSGFTPSPSVAQAANELRSAAGEKARDFIHATEDKAVALKGRAVETAQQFRVAAAGKATAFKNAATDRAMHLKESATEQWQDTRVKAKELHVTAEDYIRQNPTKCVLGALGVGFLIGLITRR